MIVDDDVPPAALAGLDDFTIEVPSWAYGNSGTRFKVFAQAGVPRDPYEKIADAAQVHAFTGAAPTVALHIPWDRVDDFAALAAHADRVQLLANDLLGLAMSPQPGGQPGPHPGAELADQAGPDHELVRHGLGVRRRLPLGGQEVAAEPGHRGAGV